MLVLDLRISRVVDPEVRQRRAEYRLLSISHNMRVLGVEPERLILDDRRHRRGAAAESRLQILVVDLWLNEIFEKILGHLDVFRPFGNQAATVIGFAWHRLAVV